MDDHKEQEPASYHVNIKETCGQKKTEKSNASDCTMI
jgi:hypothetical protein